MGSSDFGLTTIPVWRLCLLAVGAGESAGDEEHAESAVVAVGEAACDAAVQFEEAVDRFGAAVICASGIQVGQERLAPLP